MIEKMNEPAGPLFSAVLFGIGGLLSLGLLALGLLAYLDHHQVKQTPWYKECQSLLRESANVQDTNEYLITHACNKAIYLGDQPNKYAAAATQWATPEQKKAIQAHLRAGTMLNCSFRGCRPQENAG